MRPFIRALTLLLTAALPASAVAAADTTVVVRADHPGPVIDKNVYAQFSEHLGSGIYGGVFVGEDSPIPNTRGLRDDVIAALRELRVPMVRWPGGCFADEYYWRDGINTRPLDRTKLANLINAIMRG